MEDSHLQAAVDNEIERVSARLRQVSLDMGVAAAKTAASIRDFVDAYERLKKEYPDA